MAAKSPLRAKRDIVTIAKMLIQGGGAADCGKTVWPPTETIRGNGGFEAPEAVHAGAASLLFWGPLQLCFDYETVLHLVAQEL
jgi:hypothetical protein